MVYFWIGKTNKQVVDFWGFTDKINNFPKAFMNIKKNPINYNCLKHSKRKGGNRKKYIYK